MSSFAMSNDPKPKPARRYTFREAAEAAGIHISTLSKLLNGRTIRRTRKDGSVYEREVPPFLAEGRDYIVAEDVLFTEEAIRRIQERRGPGRPPKILRDRSDD